MNKIQVIKAGITEITADAIVNAANHALKCGGGVCGSIFQAAGCTELTAACQKIGHCDTGEAVITPGFHSKAKHIIHTVGPFWSDGKHGEPEKLYHCYYRSLALAKDAGCHTIAFPLISAGKFSCPIEDAWREAILACSDFVQDYPEYGLAIAFAVLDDQILAIGEKAIKKYWQTYAKKTDWKTYDMPAHHAEFLYHCHIPHDELRRARQGFIPQGMDDKWFLYYEGKKLYLHRSWTGTCFYIIEFLPDDLTRITINQNAEHSPWNSEHPFDALSVLHDILDNWAGLLHFNPHETNVQIIHMKHNFAIPLDTLHTETNTAGNAVYFHKPEEPNGGLSNWYTSEFDLDGMHFTSAEQYIMYRKCLLFCDYKSAEAVMKTNDPAEQQQIGRNASGYQEKVWAGMRQLVLEKALLAKFSQNEYLRELLFATEDAYLVECAKTDRIWACGRGLYDEARRDLPSWPGQNLLGFTLMAVRNRLWTECPSSDYHVTDIHSHVVFGVDDGAIDLDMSLAMLRSMEQQGVRHVFCTSHSSANPQKYNKNFHLLQDAAKNAGIEVTLHTGREILCSRQYMHIILDNLNDGSYPTLADSQFALVEFPKEASAYEILSCCREIIDLMECQSNGKTIIPVIAHAEQYRSLLKDEESYQYINLYHLKVQINAYSLVEEHDEEIRTLARKLLDDRLVTFIGSDCHQTYHRPPKLQTGIDYIYSHCDPEYAKDICYRNADRLILGENNT